jgi:hypothetical protein
MLKSTIQSSIPDSQSSGNAIELGPVTTAISSTYHPELTSTGPPPLLIERKYRAI